MERKRILVVDDEPAVLKVCVMALERFPLEIVPAPDENQALKLLKEKRFDAALVDLKLKEKDGLKIIKAALKLYPGIRAILMTGTLKSDELEKKIKKVRIDKVIFKPFTVDQLRETVRECLHI